MIDRYAVIGNPIAQSRSPVIHAAFAHQFGHALHYEAMLAEPDAFVSTVRAYIASGAKGMNVTAPFKLDALRLSDHLSERARAAGAVNTLSFDQDGIHGDNTDGVGLVDDIQSRLGFPFADRRVLIIGAGGAARGILLPILQAGPAQVLLVNRTEARAQDLRRALQCPDNLQAGPLTAADDQAYDIIIHATSAGLMGQAGPQVRFVCAPGALAYDLAYAPRATPFMQHASTRGAAVLSDGLGMLVGQAAESYRIWRGVLPDVAPVLAQLRAQMQAASAAQA